MKAILLKLIRNGLGYLIIFIDFITRPQKMSRSDLLQNAVDEQLQHLSLYQFKACPFCIKVRRTLHRLNLNIELRDVSNDEHHRQALLENGGRVKVPCLRIEQNGEEIWMYESSEIIAYLDKRFGTQTQLSSL
jgi:glutaredoxin